jgi:hypothetical protein
MVGKLVKGYVYFAANEHGHVKVGFSRNPADRIKALVHTSLIPDGTKTIRLLAQIPECSRAVEYHIHRQLRRFQISGTTEWFESNPGLHRLIMETLERFDPPPPIANPVDIAISLDPEEYSRRLCISFCRAQFASDVRATD